MRFSSAMTKILPKLLILFSLLLSVLMIDFLNVSEAYARMNEDVIVEHLRLSVPSEKREAWLKAEKDSWEPWLAKKQGFLGRQLFWDDQNEQAVLLISWASREEWKSIPKSEIDQIQEDFEALAKDLTRDLKGNPFPLLFEGELLPQ
ncbi:TIGR03792 family protein [Prochlorococcus sp. MIT 1341]|uniref:TIGR03792 family protein n=1 Tax=Prochlorococcus sp. MIT 1341 TaxID=3096221 RepID=UPI002A74C26A|nr:TIGR03792 family protein [Prochlorococcus sp. MIT 1341]